MTERLYYRDPTLLVFEAVVTAVREQSGQFHTSLDRSAFYPTSGGQSHDLGHLGGVAIRDVFEDETGEVWHVTDMAVAAAGSVVTGQIDSALRKKNRQQHTAQHIISQVCIRMGIGETVSVHLGEDYGAVEIEARELTPEQLREIEMRSNEIVAGNVPVEIKFLEPHQIASTPLRKVPDRAGVVRVIKIGEFDWSACGGTHCLGSGEVRLIKLVGAETMRGHALIKFLAGDQALADYRERFEILERLAKAMTCSPADLPAKMEKLVTDNKDLAKRLLTAQKELLPAIVTRLSVETDSSGPIPIVVVRCDEFDPGLTSELARLTAEHIGGLCCLVCGSRLTIATVAASSVSAGQLIKSIGPVLGLKGGGNERLAQAGGAESPDLVRLRETIQAQLRRD